MFDSKNKNTSNKSLADRSLDEFIHTMKDDINPSLKNISTTNSLEKNNSPFALGNEEIIPIRETSVPEKIIPDIPNKSAIYSKTESLPQSNNINQLNLSNRDSFKKETLAIKKASGTSRLLIIIILVSLLLIVLGGIYYLWTIKNNSSTIETTINEDLPETEPSLIDNQIIISPLSEKYLTEKPNFLSLETETMTPDEIKKIIVDTASEIGSMRLREPIEFIITDINNNPIAFPIFATMSNINLSPELLENLDEEFSFYVQNVNSQTRTGVVIETKDNSKVQSEMLREEKNNLIENLSFLFINETFTSKKDFFTRTDYNNISIRYLNLNPDNTISIDYGIYKNNLIIATSMNSFRSILDKMLEKDSVLIDSNTEAF